MSDKSIWNNEFILEWSYRTCECPFLGVSSSYEEERKGSLKSIIRNILDERRHGHASISISTSEGYYLKEIIY